MSEDRRLKNGAVILVAGYTNERKSTIVRELIKDSGLKNKIALDDNREYWTAEKPTDWTVFYDFDFFKKSIVAQDANGNYVGVQQCAVVVEEASKYLKPQRDEDIAKIYVACEHKFIACFMIFTSLQDIPRSVFFNSHYLMLFNTMDTEESLEGYRKKLVPLLSLPRSPGNPVWVNTRQFIGADKATGVE